MLQPARHLALPRIARRLVLLALLGAAAVFLAPCKMVDDQLLDVSLHREAAGECYARCARTYAEGVAKETKRHLEAVKACGDDLNCRSLERARFRENMARLKETARRCREECHHQGQGRGR